MHNNDDEDVPLPQPDDVGTRLQHLMDYKESLEICIEILKTKEQIPINKQRLFKFSIALEIVKATIDTFSGYGKEESQYKLYKLLNTVPATKEGLISIGGTPLNENNRKN